MHSGKEHFTVEGREAAYHEYLCIPSIVSSALNGLRVRRSAHAGA